MQDGIHRLLDGPPLGIDEELNISDDGIALPALSALPLSALIGSVELYDCVDVDDVPEDRDDGGFASGPVCWLLRDPRALSEAVPVQGGAVAVEPAFRLAATLNLA